MKTKRTKEELYTPGEAIKYLAEQRGIHLTVTALRMRRKRHTAQAHKVLGRTSLWTKQELDALVPPRKYTRKSPPQGEE